MKKVNKFHIRRITWILLITFIVVSLVYGIILYFKGKEANAAISGFASAIISLVTLMFYELQLRRTMTKTTTSGFSSRLSGYLRADEIRCPLFKKESIEIITSTRSEGFKLKKDCSIFDNFYEYFVCNTKNIPDNELSLQQIHSIWDVFVKNLDDRSSLDVIFRYLYRSINSILSEHESESFITDEIENFQSMLTSKELFAYLINLIHFSDRFRRRNVYIEKLQQYNFFKGLIESEEYKQIESYIPYDIERFFYHEL